MTKKKRRYIRGEKEERFKRKIKGVEKEKILPNKYRYIQRLPQGLDL